MEESWEPDILTWCGGGCVGVGLKFSVFVEDVIGIEEVG